jgi:glutamyl-tRNA reductase
VIGAGEMAEVTARCIQQHNPKSLGIINRSLDRARALAMRLQGAEPLALDQLADALASADVVISATGAPHTIITKAMVNEAIRRRRGRTLLLVDIAMPRDIDSACSSLNDVYLFDIDDLKQVVEGNRKERLRAAEDAARIIDESVAGYERWLAHMAVAPALQHFNIHLDQLFRREAQKTLSRDSFQEFNEEQTGRVWQLLDVLASRLTADAGRGLRNMVDQGKGQDAAELLMRLFRGESRRTEDDPT